MDAHPAQDVTMTATATLARPARRTAPRVSADRVREVLLELTYRLHATRAVKPASPSRRGN
jgi:hypothetical protein